MVFLFLLFLTNLTEAKFSTDPTLKQVMVQYLSRKAIGLDKQINCRHLVSKLPKKYDDFLMNNIEYFNKLRKNQCSIPCEDMGPSGIKAEDRVILTTLCILSKSKKEIKNTTTRLKSPFCYSICHEVLNWKKQSRFPYFGFRYQNCKKHCRKRKGASKKRICLKSCSRDSKRSVNLTANFDPQYKNCSDKCKKGPWRKRRRCRRDCQMKAFDFLARKCASKVNIKLFSRQQDLMFGFRSKEMCCSMRDFNTCEKNIFHNGHSAIGGYCSDFVFRVMAGASGIIHYKDNKRNFFGGISKKKTRAPKKFPFLGIKKEFGRTYQNQYKFLTQSVLSNIKKGAFVTYMTSTSFATGGHTVMFLEWANKAKGLAYLVSKDHPNQPGRIILRRLKNCSHYKTKRFEYPLLKSSPFKGCVFRVINPRPMSAETCRKISRI